MVRLKIPLALGTGLLGGHFSFDGRLSRINSDGYIDRAFSHLKSYFLSGAYYGKNSVLRLNVFSGYEQTYQAWDGVPEDSVKAGNRRYNELGYINCKQQLIIKIKRITIRRTITSCFMTSRSAVSFHLAGHCIIPRDIGYYEEYKNADSLKNYGITPVIVGGTTIDSNRPGTPLWLNNNFYGATYNLNYKPNNNLSITLGGAYNEYKGAHYDNIEWTQESTNIPPDYEYSRNDAKKTDFNIFGRAEYHIGNYCFMAICNTGTFIIHF